MEAKEYLKNLLFTKKEIDDWLVGKDYFRQKYDSELGYLHRNINKGANGLDASALPTALAPLGSPTPAAIPP